MTTRTSAALALIGVLALIGGFVLFHWPEAPGDPLITGGGDESGAPLQSEPSETLAAVERVEEDSVDDITLSVALVDKASGVPLDGYSFVYHAAMTGEDADELVGAEQELVTVPCFVDIVAAADGYLPVYLKLLLELSDKLTLELSRPATVRVRAVHNGKTAPCSGAVNIRRLGDIRTQFDLSKRSSGPRGSTLAPQLPVGPAGRVPEEAQTWKLDRPTLRKSLRSDDAGAYWFERVSWGGSLHRGEAFIPQVRVGEKYAVFMWPEFGFTDGVARDVELVAGDNLVEVEVSPANLLTGQVLLKGSPVVARQVCIWGLATKPCGDSCEKDNTCCDHSTDVSDVGHVSVLTDRSGEFTARVNRAQVRVLVTHEPRIEEGRGSGLGYAAYKEVRFQNGMAHVELHLGDERDIDGFINTLRVQVVDQTGRPLSGAHVSLSIFGPAGTTDESGFIRLFGFSGLAGHHSKSLALEKRRRKPEYLSADWRSSDGEAGDATIRVTHQEIHDRGGELPPIVMTVTERRR